MRCHPSLPEERLKSHEAIFRSTLLDGHATDVSGSFFRRVRGMAQGGNPAIRGVRGRSGLVPVAGGDTILKPPSAPVGRPSWGAPTRTSPRFPIRVKGGCAPPLGRVRTGQDVSGHE